MFTVAFCTTSKERQPRSQRTQNVNSLVSINGVVCNH